MGLEDSILKYKVDMGISNWFVLILYKTLF